MQRSIDIEINVATFVSEVACGTVFARMQVRKSRQLRVLWRGATGCHVRVHSGLSIEMRGWIHPDETKVTFNLRASSDVQGLFEVCRVHLLFQCLLLS
jgi:hypothetical protein